MYAPRLTCIATTVLTGVWCFQDEASAIQRFVAKLEQSPLLSRGEGRTAAAAAGKRTQILAQQGSSSYTSNAPSLMAAPPSLMAAPPSLMAAAQAIVQQRQRRERAAEVPPLPRFPLRNQMQTPDSWYKRY
eukprot:3306877-Rhodomonas_salina.1